MNLPLVEIRVERVGIAVIVEVDLEDRVRNTDNLAQRVEQQDLLLGGRVLGLEDLEEDLLEHDVDLVLELGRELGQEHVEDLERVHEHGGHGVERVADHGQDEVLLHRGDKDLARLERVVGRLEDLQEQLQRQNLGAHGERRNVGRGSRLHRQVAQRAEDQARVLLQPRAQCSGLVQVRHAARNVLEDLEHFGRLRSEFVRVLGGRHPKRRHRGHRRHGRGQLELARGPLQMLKKK